MQLEHPVLPEQPARRGRQDHRAFRVRWVLQERPEPQGFRESRDSPEPQERPGHRGRRVFLVCRGCLGQQVQLVQPALLALQG